MLSAILHETLVVWTLRSFLAALFLTAALSKLTAIDEFHGVVRNFRLLPDGLARPVAMVLPVVEMAIAAGLLIGPLARPAALAAAALLAVFGLAITVNVLRGRTQIDCGCFRNGMKQRIGWATVARNGVLTALALGAGALLAQGRAASAGDIATGLAAGLTLTLLYMGAEMLGGFVAMNNRASSTKGR